MNRRTGPLGVLLLVVSLAWCPTPVLAVGPDDRSGGAPPADTEIPIGQVARYLVTYAKSNVVTGAVRSATVVTVTNQGTATCGISVDWIIGQDTLVSCTTNLSVPVGHTVDFCSRSLPGPVTTCNATCFPALTFFEGKARVASTIATSTNNCQRIAVSARTYYSHSSTSDAFPAGSRMRRSSEWAPATPATDGFGGTAGTLVPFP
jgi:hypothetical protein